MATCSCILAWETPWTEEPGELWSMETQESDTTQQLNNENMYVQFFAILSHVYIYVTMVAIKI